MIKLSVPTHGKKDNIGLHPSDLLANMPEFTGRQSRTEEAIESMVTSLLAEGQIQDVVYRINFDRKPVLVAGVTRAIAADRINKRGLTDAKGNVYNEANPFILTARCKTFKQGKDGDLDALVLTYFENSTATRTPMTAMDEAQFVTVLSDNYGLSDTQIAERLRQKVQWVAGRKKAMNLDTETQNKLAAGAISFDTAMTALEIAPEAREAVFAAAETNGNGKVTAAALKIAARESGAKTRTNLKRSEKEFNDYLKSAIANTAVGPLQNFLFGMADFRKGALTADDLNLLKAALEGVEGETETTSIAAVA